MSNNRVKIRLERALCTLDAPLFDGEITYNRFSLPKGCTYEGKSLDNMYFYPYVAYVDDMDEGYCVASFPSKYNVQVVNMKNEDGALVKNEVYLKAEELKDIIENRSLDLNCNKEIDANEDSRRISKEIEHEQENNAVLEKDELEEEL